MTINHQSHKIILSTMEGYYPVRPEEIIYCKASDSYTQIFTEDNKQYMVAKVLKDFETLLEPHNFFRIHKSFLINIDHIEKVMKSDGVTVIMSNQKQLPVSFRKKAKFITMLKGV